MPKRLLIVESPAKAKTIGKYLGEDYMVASSYGHIRDLAKGDSAIDVENNFEPQYIVSDDKAKVVKELKKLAKKADEVILATDEDREGEAISWHLCSVLDLDPKTAKRITYTEVTKSAIQAAVDNPRYIDINLVNAQQARRLLDRLVGFKLSPVLWRKVKPSLSAGRVQSVAVRLVVEREREIQKFEPQSFYKLTATFIVENEQGKEVILKAEKPQKIATAAEVESLLESCKGATYTIGKIEKKPAKKSPSPPFTTSTLQQEASRKIGFSVSRTMQVAQKLYEAGHITYMRTDSVNISAQAQQAAAIQISSQYGEEYVKTRRFKTKVSGAQEAHEAIRPSKMEALKAGANNDEKRLYDLIWKRTIASQMSEAKLERTIVDIHISGTEEVLKAKGEVLIFDGFLKVYNISRDEEDEEEDTTGLLPPLSVGQQLPLKEMLSTERFTKAAARYNEASLVRKLEELGIGRPSTYAPTISTIQKRGYVLKDSREGVVRQYRIFRLANDILTDKTDVENTGAEKNKLFPTDIGMVVNDFLIEHFDRILDYGFTASIENQFDDIANGEKQWQEVLKLFYDPFHTEVEKTIETAERASGERILGKHPESGYNVLVRIGRYGPMGQIGNKEDGEDIKPRFAKLRVGQHIESITLEEVLELFKLPRIVGQFEEKDMKVAIGRFGPYVQHDGKFTSLGKEEDPYKITGERAQELIEAKRKADAEKIINTFPEHDIQVLNGRWGPFIKQGKGRKGNFKIPTKEEKEKAAELTLERCLEIIASSKK